MTAADRREELEAAVHRLLTKARCEGIAFGVMHPDPATDTRDQAASVILAAADAAIQAAVDEAVGAYRLAAARAEHSPATMPGARA